MSAVKTLLDPDQLRTSLAQFWAEALSIEPTRQGLAIALPQTGADGWQLVLDLSAHSPATVRVSDGGRTLGGLAALGQNVDAAGFGVHLEAILRQSQLEREGWEIFRWLSTPIDPIDLHVMAEAIVAISHLHVLHEPTVRGQDVADRTLRRIFTERHLDVQSNAQLAGRTEQRLQVDYLTELARPVAFQILRRRGRLLPVMEQWGYRWQDIQKVRPDLMPVMLYDPALQEMDDASRAIGEEVCSLFCAYDQTDRIHGVLDLAQTYPTGDE